MADKLEQAALSGALTSPPSIEPDPDGREPLRLDDDDEGYTSDHAASRPSATTNGLTVPPTSQSMSRGWSGNTGPKGVLQDFKASHGKSGAILGGGREPLEQQMEKASLGGGGNAGQENYVGRGAGKKGGRSKSRGGSSGSEESEGEREAREQYRAQRLAEIAREQIQAANGGRRSPGVVNVDRQGRKLFGHLREVGVQNFVQQIDNEKDEKQTAVVIHLYDPAVEACQVLNVHLSTLARRHPHTKFLKGLASELDYFSDSTGPAAVPPTHTLTSAGISIPTLTPSPSRQSFSTISSGFSASTSGTGDPFSDERRPSNPFLDPRGRRRATDSDVLPTILWYRGGEFVKSLHAIERELPDGEIKRGDEGCREVQELLASHGLIGMSDSMTAANGQLYTPYRRSNASDSD